jgi:hypothetical protein
MTTAEQQQSTKNEELASGLSDLRVGTCLSINWPAGTAKVNIPGSTIDMPMVSAPVVNARCWVGFFANRPIVLGPVARPPLATATAAQSGGLVKVTGDDGQQYVVASDGFSITSGTRVLLAWGDRGGYVIGLPGADPLTGAPINNGGTIPGGGPTTVQFNSIDGGSQNSAYMGGSGTSGFWTGDVWCGDTTLGAWIFGTQIADTIPDSAVIDAVSISVSQTGGSGGSAPNFGLHNLPSKSGTVVPTSAVAVGGGSGQKGLPTSFGDALKTGAAFGIATRHGGWWIYSPTAALTITWH